MSKLVLAFIQPADTEAIADGLRRSGQRFTRIPAFGGFLGEPIETFAMAVEADALPAVLEIFHEAATPRDIEVPLVLLERLADWRERTVHHGGATILVSELGEVIRY